MKSAKKPGINRRNFFKIGAAAAAAAATAHGRSDIADDIDLSSPLGEKSASQLDKHLQEWERGIDYISLIDHMPECEAAEGRRENADADYSTERKVIKSMFITGMYHDLSDKDREHPAVVEKMEACLPEIGNTVVDVTEDIGSTSLEESRLIAEYLESEEDIEDKIVADFEEYAERCGIPMRRRRHLKHIVKKVTWQMKKQSPKAVMDHYFTRAAKIAKKHGLVLEAGNGMNEKTAYDESRWAKEFDSYLEADPEIAALRKSLQGKIAAKDMDAAAADKKILTQKEKKRAATKILSLIRQKEGAESAGDYAAGSELGSKIAFIQKKYPDIVIKNSGSSSSGSGRGKEYYQGIYRVGERQAKIGGIMMAICLPASAIPFAGWFGFSIFGVTVGPAILISGLVKKRTAESYLMVR